MSTPKIGNKAPAFTVESTEDKKIKLSQFAGNNVVLYFYPKDNTPGCTNESKDFRDNYEEFRIRDTVILGVSRDSLASHHKFKDKLGLPFHLLSDPDEVLCKKYDVIKEKNLYGKIHLGIERSTFLINKDGKLVYEWRKVRVPGHVEAVLATIDELL